MPIVKALYLKGKRVIKYALGQISCQMGLFLPKSPEYPVERGCLMVEKLIKYVQYGM
jgi:hypothetical protein